MVGFNDLGGKFVTYIEENGRPPESIIKDGKEYPLKGFMATAAIAKIMGDIDFLGYSGGNTGFVIKDNEAEAICVDPGLGLRKVKDTFNSKNITIASKSFGENPVIIFSKLTDTQKQEFIKTLYKYIHCENLPALVEFLVKRGGPLILKKM